MTQGIFGGATSYEEQSLTSINADINRWIEYTHEIKVLMNELLEQAKISGYWNKVGFNFKSTIYASISYFDTIIEDLKIARTAITNNSVTSREVHLLDKIGKNAVKYNNEEYPKSYKDDRCEIWKDYEDPNFKNVEDMYCRGRDYFVTLQDARNAAYRLQDYINKASVVNNTVNFGGDATAVQIQQNTSNSLQSCTTNNTQDFDKAQKVLDEICKYEQHFEAVFGKESEQLKGALEDANDAVKNRNITKLKKASEVIKSIAGNVNANLIASGIIEVLKNIQL